MSHSPLKQTFSLALLLLGLGILHAFITTVVLTSFFDTRPPVFDQCRYLLCNITLAFSTRFQAQSPVRHIQKFLCFHTPIYPAPENMWSDKIIALRVESR
ncbi:uncharacterized protein EDB93DRAFT_1332129 [Suillus bovinus]|uniref:uncharacterized protein n=1 Tax=Suillus bovinus TaxID=48563 RepID=UPI001B879543|nr:uncharacterized protein EDB93DRAFT_1332129 [Suillus bovinus]KAG2130149.1 hypothetical protein EDB93DRAFT_1332129 [Suillus bovinus]